jgi:hypothetical protein
MPDNDVAQVHRYLDLGARLDVCKGPVNRLATDAVNELLVTKPGKPVLLAESGAVEPSHTGPFKLYGKDTNGVILHDVLFAPFFAGAAGPGHIWHWDAYVAKNNLWRHFARFAEAVRGIDPPAEHFQPTTLPHDRLDVSMLEGARTWLIWCRDSKNDWRSELANNTPPEMLGGDTPSWTQSRRIGRREGSMLRPVAQSLERCGDHRRKDRPAGISALARGENCAGKLLNVARVPTQMTSLG